MSANIRDGELRKTATWAAHRDAVALLDNVYHRVAAVDKENQLITLQDGDGRQRLFSPREASAEGVTLYREETITVSAGDRMRFSKSDAERGYVANSVWEVKSVPGDSVTLSGGHSTRTLSPGKDNAQRHIDLAYAVTAHGAQGASEPFAIALEGVEGGRKQMVGFESAYVALSRMKQHVQVYTDSREGWTTAVTNSKPEATAHDILAPRNDRAVTVAEQLLRQARPLADTAAGRAALLQAGLAQGSPTGKFISPGRKYPQPHVALPAFDKNGIAGMFMLINSWRVCRAGNITERVGYAALWAVMVLLMNAGDVLQSVGGLAIAVLALAVCADTGQALERFWPRHFFVAFYAGHLALLGWLATL